MRVHIFQKREEIGMKLWMVQPVEAINIIEKTGAFTCDETKSDKDFRKAYEWIAKEMDKRQIAHPKDLTLPLWAWHTRDWKQKKPDLRNIGLGTPGEKSVCIEFEIDDLQVLLSDFFAWHSVLNGGFYNDSHTEAEWNEKDAWYEALSGKQKGIETLKSWQKVFDVNAFENEFCQNGRYIQATFWKLTKEMITDVRYFTAR